MNYLLFDILANELAKASNFPINEIYEKLEQPSSSEIRV